MTVDPESFDEIGLGREDLGGRGSGINPAE
jgi:hypothetical protein